MAEREHLDDLAKQINEAYRRFKDTPRDRALMLRVGELLGEAKTICPETTWPAWVGEHFEGSAKIAQNLIKLHRVERVLLRVMDFINDDSHLTPEGIAAREDFLREVEATEQDMEAIRQEHMLD